MGIGTSFPSGLGIHSPPIEPSRSFFFALSLHCQEEGGFSGSTGVNFLWAPGVLATRMILRLRRSRAGPLSWVSLVPPGTLPAATHPAPSFCCPTSPVPEAPSILKPSLTRYFPVSDMAGSCPCPHMQGTAFELCLELLPPFHMMEKPLVWAPHAYLVAVLRWEGY